MTGERRNKMCVAIGHLNIVKVHFLFWVHYNLKKLIKYINYDKLKQLLELQG